jgi:FAD/FMN-containing dehydrogenase
VNLQRHLILNQGNAQDQNLHYGLLSYVYTLFSHHFPPLITSHLPPYAPQPSSGHAADQNLHLNILAHIDIPSALQINALGTTAKGVEISGELVDGEHEYIANFKDYIQATLNKHVFRLVIARRGSISAEHGIGQQKRDALATVARSPEEMMVMRALKTAMDPTGILNPGKVL